MDRLQHIHILGIGGSGLSAIARLLLEQGLRVSGCDQTLNAAAEELRAAGASVLAGHDPAHVQGVDALLATSAAVLEHPEIVAARERDIPVLTRHDLWRSWSAERPVLAVAGTHGKTTTSGMLAHVLVSLGRECGYLIGAPLPGLGAARWGSGPLVLEADEYARTFLALSPRLAIVTNIDWDHVDVYPSQQEYQQAFLQFARQALSDPQGTLLVCGDDPGARQLLSLQDERVISYGLDAGNHWLASGLVAGQSGYGFVVEQAGRAVAEAQLAIPGEHNVRNALGVIAACASWGLEPAAAARALASFRGAARRFEPKGAVGGISVFDDYAHHPVEIRATLQAARSRFPGRRIVVYFQPHTFSRLQAFLPEFAQALALADVVRIGEIYAAREAQEGVSAAQLLALIEHHDARFVGEIDAAVADLLGLLWPGDVLLTLGAGDGYRVGEQVVAAMGGNAEGRVL